jgi:hypothetical protein
MELGKLKLKPVLINDGFILGTLLVMQMLSS